MRSNSNQMKTLVDIFPPGLSLCRATDADLEERLRGQCALAVGLVGDALSHGHAATLLGDTEVSLLTPPLAVHRIGGGTAGSPKRVAGCQGSESRLF